MRQLVPQLERYFLQSWWMVAFILLCYACYESASNRLRHERNYLEQQRRDLVQTLDEQQLLHTRLQASLVAQGDPDCVELTLRRVLGVIPQGYRLLKPQESDHD
jgi:hypothetical protein